MNVYELAQLHLREAHANDQTSLCLARELVSRERIPLIIDQQGLVTTGMNAMSIAQWGEYRWYAVDPSLLNVGYALDALDVRHWCERYPQQITALGISLNGQPHSWSANLLILDALLAASRFTRGMKQAS